MGVPFLPTAIRPARAREFKCRRRKTASKLFAVSSEEADGFNLRRDRAKIQKKLFGARADGFAQNPDARPFQAIR
jgi:hypothetical protein